MTGFGGVELSTIESFFFVTGIMYAVVAVACTVLLGIIAVVSVVRYINKRRHK